RSEKRRSALTARNGIAMVKRAASQTVMVSSLLLAKTPQRRVRETRQRRRNQAESGGRPGRQLLQGLSPTASARWREPKSVSWASGVVEIEPQLGTQYSV